MSIYINGYEADPALMSGDDVIPFVELSGQRDAWTTVAKFSTLLNTLPMSGGTANGVLYLNGSKVVTSGSALTFDGTTLSALTSGTSVYFSGGDSSVTRRLQFYATSTTNTGDTQNINALGSTGVLAFALNSSERMRLDASGNLGLGVTPSAWTGSGGRNIEVGAAGNALFGSVSLTTYTSNANFDSSWKYSRTGFASRYEQQSGDHKWFTAPSWNGTGSNLISFTQAMTLDENGNLGVGVTNPTAKLEVYGGASGTVTNVQVGNASTAFQVGVDSSNNCQIRTAQNVSMLFYTNATERVRIKSTGQVRFVPLAADPAGAAAGDVYYNSGTNKLRLYDGSTWVNLN